MATIEETKIDIDNLGKGEVQVFKNGAKAGKMDILVKRSMVTVYHTEVSPAYGGRGFAKLLLDQLVSYARANHFKIIPLCPYVSKQFSLQPENYEDVWNKGWHA